LSGGDKEAAPSSKGAMHWLALALLMFLSACQQSSQNSAPDATNVSAKPVARQLIARALISLIPQSMEVADDGYIPPASQSGGEEEGGDDGYIPPTAESGSPATGTPVVVAPVPVAPVTGTPTPTPLADTQVPIAPVTGTPTPVPVVDNPTPTPIPVVDNPTPTPTPVPPVVVQPPTDIRTPGGDESFTERCTTMSGAPARFLVIHGTHSNQEIRLEGVVALKIVGDQANVRLRLDGSQSYVKALCVWMAGNESTLKADVHTNVGSLLYVGRGNETTSQIIVGSFGSISKSLSVDLGGTNTQLTIVQKDGGSCIKPDPLILSGKDALFTLQ
jgi:hypothetical protein